MAKDTTELDPNKKTIFYAYEYIERQIKLKKRGPFISWKYGRRYKDEISGEILFEDGDKDIRFEDGVFVTQDADQINYLNLYNDGGKFKLVNGGREVEVKRDPQMNVIISTKDLITNLAPASMTEVTKEISVLPKSAIGLFDVQALKDFCIAEGIDMPAEKTKDALIDVLTQAGRIK